MTGLIHAKKNRKNKKNLSVKNYVKKKKENASSVKNAKKIARSSWDWNYSMSRKLNNTGIR